MSDTPFGEKSIRQTVKNLLKEKKCKNSTEEYLFCIDMLENIIRTGEVRSEAMKDIISGAIANFEAHIDLGIIVDGRFSSIDSHMAARHNIKAGNFISGHQFPVFTKSQAEKILEEPVTTELPKDCIWDIDSKSVIYIKFYYMKHPGELMGISKNDISRLGLTDFFRDIFPIMKEHKD